MLNPFLVVSYVFIGVPQFLHLYFEKACIVVAVQCSNLKFITSSHIYGLSDPKNPYFDTSNMSLAQTNQKLACY